MAKPDLDNGYLKLAHELFAALAYAGFTKWEWVVLREVFDQIYGPYKHALANLSSSAIAGRVGTYKQSIDRAIRTLIDSGVLARVDGGALKFIKNYEAWMHCGKPRLTVHEQARCRAARYTVKSKPVVNNGADESTDVVNNGADESQQRRLLSSALALTQTAAPPTPPRRGTRAKEPRTKNELKKEDKKSNAHSASNQLRDSSQASTELPPTNQAPDSAPPRGKIKHARATPAEVDAKLEKLIATLPREARGGGAASDPKPPEHGL